MSLPQEDISRYPRIYHYSIDHQVGQGGYGIVYKARNIFLNRDVALKTGNLGTRFPDNDLIAGLRHPHLPYIYETFNFRRIPILSSEFINGQSLEKIIEQSGPVSPTNFLPIAFQICNAATHLHRQGAIHRDIKPDNVMIKNIDGTVVLIDLGIADKPGRYPTSQNNAVSPNFSSPEQWQSDPTDERSDIYSLGATFYYMLTGVMPAKAPDRIDGTHDLEFIGNLSPNLPNELKQAIMIALEIDPNHRQSSVQELRNNLTGIRDASLIPYNRPDRNVLEKVIETIKYNMLLTRDPLERIDYEEELKVCKLIIDDKEAPSSKELLKERLEAIKTAEARYGTLYVPEGLMVEKWRVKSILEAISQGKPELDFTNMGVVTRELLFAKELQLDKLSYYADPSLVYQVEELRKEREALPLATGTSISTHNLTLPDSWFPDYEQRRFNRITEIYLNNIQNQFGGAEHTPPERLIEFNEHLTNRGLLPYYIGDPVREFQAKDKVQSSFIERLSILLRQRRELKRRRIHNRYYIKEKNKQIAQCRREIQIRDLYYS